MKTEVYGKKLIIGITILLIGAGYISTISANINTKNNEFLDIKPVQSSVFWEDNFDSYDVGSSMHGQGGWKGWDNDPTWTAYVTADQARSTPHSVDIVGDADIVHEYEGCTSGQWVYTAWQYIPEDYLGQGDFILLDDYTDGAGQDNHWAVQIRFDSDQELVESEFDGVNLPMIKGEWVELRVDIDLDTDWFTFYYDGEELISKAWTAGVNNDFTGNLVINAVDLWANLATSVYYDDMSLDGGATGPDLYAEGDLSWVDVETGSTVTGSFIVENIGAPGSELDWEIDSNPSWGTWTFNPNEGTDLTPEDGQITVNVEVVAPDEPETDFSGEVKIVNSENSADYVILDVSLSTPMNQESDGLFGWVFLRGLVFNPREDGSTINARAINLQYFEITPQGINKGVARLRKVSFRNGIFIKMSERGLFGYTIHVSGFCHGGIEIQ